MGSSIRQSAWTAPDFKPLLCSCPLTDDGGWAKFEHAEVSAHAAAAQRLPNDAFVRIYAALRLYIVACFSTFVGAACR